MVNTDLKLQIITPDRIFFEEEVERVVFKTTEGDVGVLRGHIPMTTALVSGVVEIRTKEGEKKAVLHGGFSEITPESVTLLTDAAEWPDEIDVKRAKEAKERAKSYLEEAKERTIDEARAEAALYRAITRIRLVEHQEEDD